MLAKPFSSPTASMVGLLGLIGHVTAHPMLMADPLVARDPSAVDLDPKTYWAGIGATPDAELKDWDSFYWAKDGFVANLTCTGGQDRKMLNVARLGSDVSALDCSDPTKLTMTFKDSAALSSAQAQWSWLDHEKNSVILVADGESCGGPNGRKEWTIWGVTYDDSSASAVLSGEPTSWEDLVADYTMNIKSSVDDTDETGLSKRFGAQGVDLSNDFSRNFFSQDINGINLSVDCAHCATTGAVDFDLNFGLFDGLTGSITARNNLGASIGLGITASAELGSPIDLGSVNLLSLPLSPINIAGVANLGPELVVGITSQVDSISGSLSVDFGVAVTIPDGTTLRIGSDSDAIVPNFQQIGPNFSAAVQITASLSPVVTFDISATILGKGLVAGIGLEAPKLTATATAQATNAGGLCGDPNGIASVELDVDVGVNLNIFGGFGSPTDQPNAKSIFSTSTPLFGQCLVITSGTPDSGNNGQINGNDGTRPQIGTVTYSDGTQQGLFNSGANSDDTPINPLSDSQDIQTIAIDGDKGLANCAVFSAFDQTLGCQGDVILTVDAGTSADVPADNAKSVLCIRCPNLV